MNEAKSKAKKYDCIVPVSGGRDSTFVLYVARAVYDLRVLAINYDNEFRTDQAAANLQKASKILNVDLLCVRSKRNIARQIVRSQIRLAMPLGLGAICNGMCVACTYGYKSAVYRAAEQFQVPLILWGESNGEATQGMQQVVEDAWRKGRRVKHNKLKTLFGINYYLAQQYRLRQRLEFPIPGNSVLFDGTPTMKSEHTKEIRIFDYLPWDRKQIKNTITSELGWQKPPDRISTWRTDCKLVPFVNYCFIKRFGCSKSCFGYCKMINSGQMTRDEAVKQEEYAIATHADGIDRLLAEEVGLRKGEASKIVAAD